MVRIETDYGSGSGFFMENPDESGSWYIVTAEHVVGDSETITAIHPVGGTVEDIEVLGREEIADLALIDAGPDDFDFPDHDSGVDYLQEAGGRIQFSDEINPGARTIAAGYAIGDRKNISITENNISSDLRLNWESYPAYVHTIKTDTSLAAGNSGGPLMTLEGNIIGLNSTAIEGENIYYAIAMDEIRTSFPRMLAGEVIRYRLVPPISDKYPVRPATTDGSMYLVITDPFGEFDEIIARTFRRSGQHSANEEYPFYWKEKHPTRSVAGLWDDEEEVYTATLGSAKYQYQIQFLILSYSYDFNPE